MVGPRLPNEIVVVVGQQVVAPAPMANVLAYLVPDPFRVLLLRQVQDLRHRIPLFEDARPSHPKR
jgi:hypothetical protein